MIRSDNKTFRRLPLHKWGRLSVLLGLFALAACGGGGSSSSGNGGGGSASGGGGGTNSGAFIAGRTKYVRTDATTEYFEWINSHWIIYNPLTNYFYVTDPTSNQVMVLDAASGKEVGVLGVPGAFSIDDTPDHETLYVGTQIGDVYTIDPVAMTVTQRYIAAQIGPSGFAALSALVLADGQLALLGAQGGIPSVDGSTAVGIWNSASNALTAYSTPAGMIFSPSALPLPCGNQMGNIGGFSRTVDRTKVIIASVDSDDTLCELEESGQGIYTNTLQAFTQENFRTTPDGNYIILPANTLSAPPNNTYAYVYDASTLQLVNKILVSGDTSTAAGFAVSADSKTLFVPNDWIIYAYDIASGKQTGWLPNINVPVLNGGSASGPVVNPNLQATDGTGLFVGPMEEGVGFIDTTTMQIGTVGSEFPNGYANPATGPTSGNTQVKITETSPFGTLSAVYFDSKGATNISGISGPDTYGNFGSVSATTPLGAAGSTDVYVFTTDGGMQLLPEGFSYGPTIIEVTPNMSTGEGGGSGIIYGYGFGPVGSGVPGPLPQVKNNTSGTIPPSLQVSVGGKLVQVTGFAPYAYPIQSPPFPLQALSYTIPPGSATANVNVTSGSGGATAQSALSYLPAMQQFPLPESVLAQGIYDPYSDLYYFTDANKIQVFSDAQSAWQAPITIPAPKGATQRLWGIALSPDGSKLAISDLSAQAIYLLDPSNPVSVQTFAVPTMPNYPGVTTNATGVAVSDAGVVYYGSVVNGGTGYSQFFKLDTNTGTVTPYSVQGPGETTDVYLRAELSPDNSTAYFNADGMVFSIDTATNAISFAAVDQGCCYGNYELTLSGNGTRVGATNYFYDSDLSAESGYALNDREALNIEYVYGAKLSADGNLLFQPSTNGIDVFDGRLGNLLDRVSLPVTLSANYDALVSDGKDSVLLAITGSNGDGIAIVDLTSIKEPPPLPYTEVVSQSARTANQTPSSDARTRIQVGGTPASSAGNRVVHITRTIAHP